jgi:hypothetical protein
MAIPATISPKKADYKEKPVFPENADTEEYAASLDVADPLREFRNKFIIPSKANLRSRKLAKPGTNAFLLLLF